MGEPFIRFSSKFTLVNIILSIAGNVVYGISMTHMDRQIYGGIPVYLEYYLLFISIPILGLLLTLFSLLFLYNSSNCIHSAVKYTIANLIFNAAANQVFFFCVIFPHYPLRNVVVPKWDNYAYFLPVPVFGLLVTILKIILARCCNINLPTLTCFSLPRVQYGALVCSDPQAHYVLNDDGKPELVHEEEEDEVDNQNVVLEMVADNVEAETVTEQEVLLDQAVEDLNTLTVQEE